MFGWKTYFLAELQLWYLSFQWKTCPWAEHSEGDDDEDVVVVVDFGFTTLLTSQVISDAFYREREKSDKFCSGAPISAWGSFASRKSTARDQRLYSLPKKVILWIFTLWKNSSTPAGSEPANLGSSGECDNHGTTGVNEVIGGQVCMQIQIGGMWSGLKSRSLCMTPQDQQSWRGIWWDWVCMETGRYGIKSRVVYILGRAYN